MFGTPRDIAHASSDYDSLLRHIGFHPRFVFTDPRVVVWRKLVDRENCTLEVSWPDGRPTRLHVKRYPPQRGITTPAEDEATALRALELEKIPAARLVAWGALVDGRSFIMTEDLAGYEASDKLIERGMPFERLLVPTADLAAKLHAAGLHHRDLYLCHFFAKLEGDGVDVKLIDAARVRRLPGVLTRRRWIIKDLAQFWYSTTRLPVTDEQRRRWLERYADGANLVATTRLGRAIAAKARRIAAHDVNLNRREPTRHMSIPH